MREVWTLNLEGAPEGTPPMPAESVVSACAWSDDGLVAFASSESRTGAPAARWGYTWTPSIFVVHVDHPERHSQLSGGHEHEVSHLSWVHRQMGTVLMSADECAHICLWKPVRGLVNRWELHHRLQYGPVKLAQFLNQGPLFNLPPPYFPIGPELMIEPAESLSAEAKNSKQQRENLLRVYHAAVNPPKPTPNMPKAPSSASTYEAKYRKDAVAKPAQAAGAAAAKLAESKSLRNIPGCLCLFAVSSYGEARVFVEIASSKSGPEWKSASARLSSHQLPGAQFVLNLLALLVVQKYKY